MREKLLKKYRALLNSRKARTVTMLVIAGIFLVFIGAVSGYFISVSKEPVSIQSVRQAGTTYKFIDPILFTETPESLSFPKYTPLNDALAAYVKKSQKAGSAIDVGVYFRDLDSNDWVGTDYIGNFDAASMLKVGTLMAVLRVSEVSPSILKNTLSAPAGTSILFTDTQDYYPPKDPVTSGKNYTVSDLLARLVEQSDNGANTLLVNFIGDDEILRVFQDLHIPSPDASYMGVSPQQYSHLFRILYNATYLNSSDSEEALQLLSETTFTQGLVAGVPAGTVVSHKFGESTYAAGAATIHELHDCGIVYYPGHPYFLCIMTRGTNFQSLASVIQGISKLTWSQVDALPSK